jgi:hypothetical protein
MATWRSIDASQAKEPGDEVDERAPRNGSCSNYGVCRRTLWAVLLVVLAVLLDFLASLLRPTEGGSG